MHEDLTGRDAIQSSPGYQRYLLNPPAYWEDYGERVGLSLRQMTNPPMNAGQLERTIATSITKIGLEPERGKAFARGLRRGYSGTPRPGVMPLIQF